MILNAINKRHAWLAVLVVALAAFLGGCSDEDGDKLVDEMIPADCYGAWIYYESYRDEASVEIFDIQQSGKFRYYTTTCQKVENGEYEERQDGTYTFAKGMFVFDLDGEIHAGKYADNALTIDNRSFYKINSDDVPAIHNPGSENPDKPNDDPDKPNDPDNPQEPDKPVEDPTGKVSVTTVGVDNIQPFFANLKSRLTGAPAGTETGFYIGFDPEFKYDTYRKLKAEETSRDITMKVHALYSNHIYYYRAYAVVDRVEYFGEVKKFVSAPITYSVCGRDYEIITVEGGPHGDFCMLQTEIPAHVEFTVGGLLFGPIDLNRDNRISFAELREVVMDLNKVTGIPFRLPTTSEWIYAAQGGNKSKGYQYSGSNNLDEVAWYADNAGPIARDMALKAPNELGLYDMSGNYSEFVISDDAKYLKDHNLAVSSLLSTAKKAYGGNYTSKASECTPYSSILSYIDEKHELYDADIVTPRFVFFLDPAVVTKKQQ